VPEEAFIQMGDFVGIPLRHCARRGIARALIVGMIGKLSKMAGGKMQTHAAGSEVSLDLLADLAAGIGADAALVAAIRAANTARHVLELTAARGLTGLPAEICRHVVAHGTRHAGGALRVEAELVDFDGRLLGRFPPLDHDPPTPNAAGGTP
jgi:cobalt-precorrin-5B (C1)-methyltransferase